MAGPFGLSSSGTQGNNILLVNNGPCELSAWALNNNVAAGAAPVGLHFFDIAPTTLTSTVGLMGAGQTNAGGFPVANGNTITVGDGTTTATITSTGTVTPAQIIAGVNGTANITVLASLNSAGNLVFTGTKGPALNSAAGITIGGTSTAGEKAQFGLVAGTTAGPINPGTTAANFSVTVPVQSGTNVGGKNNMSFPERGQVQFVNAMIVLMSKGVTNTDNTATAANDLSGVLTFNRAQ